MKSILLPCIAATLMLASCTSHTKKVIIYANSKAEISEAAKTITNKDNTGHVDQTYTYSTGDALTFTVQPMEGSAYTIEVPEDGYYIVNTKAKDTIIGGFQKYSTPEEANRMMTQDDLKRNIDSLKQMVAGTNISAANRTFYILPGKAAKITDNVQAEIVGPYHRMTSIAKTGDEEPEVYRFYSISEVRETIAKLEKLTGAQPAPAKP